MRRFRFERTTDSRATGIATRRRPPSLFPSSPLSFPPPSHPSSPPAKSPPRRASSADDLRVGALDSNELVAERRGAFVISEVQLDVPVTSPALGSETRKSTSVVSSLPLSASISARHHSLNPAAFVGLGDASAAREGALRGATAPPGAGFLAPPPAAGGGRRPLAGGSESQNPADARVGAAAEAAAAGAAAAAAGLRYGRRSLPPRAEPGPARADSPAGAAAACRACSARRRSSSLARTPKLLRLNLRERGTTPRARATPRRRHGTTPESGVRLRARVELALTRGRAFLLLRLNLSQRFTPPAPPSFEAAPPHAGLDGGDAGPAQTDAAAAAAWAACWCPAGVGRRSQPAVFEPGRSTPAPPWPGAAGASNDPG